MTASHYKYGFLALALLSLASTPTGAQPLELCVHENTGLVIAIPADEDCDGLLGPWVTIQFSDDDWSGAGSGAMRTTNPGDAVAVGDTDPAARLHVAYDAADPEAIIVERSDGSERALQVTSDGELVLGGESGVNARLTVNARPDEEVLRARAGGNTAFFVGADGQVGVRSSQPQAALQVNAIAGEDPLRLHLHGNDNSEVVLDAAGNFGIGEPAPIDKLSVHNTGTGRAGFFRTDNAANIAAALSATTNGSGSAVFANILNPASTNATLHAVHSGNGRAGEFEGEVTVTRRLGIGTLNPSTSLHIQGNDNGTDLLVQDDRFARMRLIADDPEDEVRLTVQARGSANANRAEIGTISNHGMVLFTNGQTRIRIGASGAVCIGAC